MDPLEKKECGELLEQTLVFGVCPYFLSGPGME